MHRASALGDNQVSRSQSRPHAQPGIGSHVRRPVGHVPCDSDQFLNVMPNIHADLAHRPLEFVGFGWEL